ncbi:MAG TPA: hypothetical protein VM324_07915 [Egibacteraceae bacterium]|nr:hypothetical protein [Egibacteraceae bacterium]
MSAPAIALDAMGGDHAPAAAVAGALRAAADGLSVLLVGRRPELAAALERAGAPGGLEIVDAAEVVGNDEDPVIGVRGKPRASIRVAAELVADGRAGALLSAGSTGATLATALLTLGRIGGIRRPAVAAVLPVGGDGVILLDAGGSADPQPDALAAYARMGVAYAQVRGVREPRVGLLNVGAEAGKGNALARGAHELLVGEPAFTGNVEPSEVFAGAVDVVVTDGFTGNVFLKTAEAVARPAQLADDAGAAVLLGVRGEVLVAHGAAGEAEFAGGLRTAHAVAGAGLSLRVAQRLGDAQPLGG